LDYLRLEVVALWLIYAAAAAAAVWLARRFAAPLSFRAGVFLAAAPLLFTGAAMLRGGIYGPADLYYGHDPWRRVAAEHGVTGIANPILSDLAFANLPWRAAVREALVNGRFPFWNRFVLGGNPLLGATQAGVFHPATWLAIFLPVALSWTFSCTFTMFLSLLCAAVFFLDFRLNTISALVGAVAWGFSTYLLFWNGWSVGPAVASFPLLLLGLRRMASGGENGVGLTVAALLLSFAGGHPETFFHCVAAGAVYFVWELLPRRSGIPRAVRSATVAGVLAFLFAGPQLFPLVEAIRHSAEYRARRATLASGRSSQSVGAGEAAARLLPAVLPFAYGIYGRSPVQSERNDGSGMPLAYGGAVLFPLAAVGLLRRARRGQPPHPAPLPGGEGVLAAPPSESRLTFPLPGGEGEERGRSIFLGFLVGGLLFGASAPGLIDVVTRLPLFSLALNYRLVFLAALGLAGLAAFGTERIYRDESSRALAIASVATLALLLAAFFLSRGIFGERGLPDSFARSSFAWEAAPVALLAAAAIFFSRNRRAILFSVSLLLLAQRFGEMGGVYPTLPADVLAPPLPELARLPADGPARVVAAGDVFRPNGATLYGLEDARGYESLVLDRFADTYPLWSKPQFASFNRVDDLASPFLSFLNVRFAIAPPGASAPNGWQVRSRGYEMTIFENPRALPRVFAPKKLRLEDAAVALEQMRTAPDFSETAWIRGARGVVVNGKAEISLRAAGPDIIATVVAANRVFLATSLPDWPGWIAESAGEKIPLVTANHAFVGFWLDAGRRTVRLHYRPASFSYGLAAFALGLLAALAPAFRPLRSSG
jgi:Bacterial membrane protein YfhO